MELVKEYLDAHNPKPTCSRTFADAIKGTLSNGIVDMDVYVKSIVRESLHQRYETAHTVGSRNPSYIDTGRPNLETIKMEIYLHDNDTFLFINQRRDDYLYSFTHNKFHFVGSIIDIKFEIDIESNNTNDPLIVKLTFKRAI